MIPYSRQNVTEEDIAAVVEVLRSDFLTQGPVVKQFETAVADYCHAKYGIATSSATAALHVACLSLGVSVGDVVWVSAVSFVASANCARYCQADVDFVDIDAGSGLISVSALEEKFKVASSARRLPKVLIVVHLAGQSCQMKEIFALCHRYQVRVIEDASHALGGRYGGEPVGSCRYSDLCVFSFHPVKPITSGEGGMITTNSPVLAKQARLYSCHGIEKDENALINKKTGEWYNEQQVLGFNYRLSDIHAALGLSQLQRVDQRVAERTQLAGIYQSALEHLPIQPLVNLDNAQSAYHLYVVRTDVKIRSELFTHLRKRGFGVNLHYIPIPCQPYYAGLGASSCDIPGAIEYAGTAISLPLYSGMPADVVPLVVAAIKELV